MAADRKLWPDVRARDLMRTDVVTVSESASLTEAVRKLADHRISGMPVTNEAGHLTGVVSIRDILDYESEEGGTRVVSSRGYFAVADDAIDDDFGFEEVEVAEESSATVGDVMTAEVHSVDIDADALSIARQLVEHRIHRVLVQERGKYVGLVTAMDLLTALVR
ncbi:MAG: CBS domain-containing protein [Planctomycetes bacterium]|nr:CBS domain-containing protein [Planctomycetota bacterium]